MRTRLALAITLTAAPAAAHFKLVAPAANYMQDSYGGPQKTAPCGQSDPGDTAVPTNAVTQLMTGSMVTITVDETIYHPGHYRVSLAPTAAMLPADPPVTAGATACGSTPINASPQMPLLADGLGVHTSPFQADQTFQVQLPAGVTCTNCVLQITEFMSSHAAPCYYHHCAIVTISDTPQNPPDAGVTGDTTVVDDSGGCSTTRGGGGLLALALGAVMLRRRRA